MYVVQLRKGLNAAVIKMAAKQTSETRFYVEQDNYRFLITGTESVLWLGLKT